MPPLLDVLTNVLDSDDGAVVVLFHVQHADLFAAELDEPLRDVRNGVEGSHQDSVEERDVGLREDVVREPVGLERRVRDPEQQVASLVVGQPGYCAQRLREAFLRLKPEACLAFGAVGLAAGQTPRAGFADEHGAENAHVDRRRRRRRPGFRILPGGQEGLEFFRKRLLYGRPVLALLDLGDASGADQPVRLVEVEMDDVVAPALPEHRLHDADFGVG
jgi:hypothetical protein